jgi:menaquinone reductase, multiheme cytochrome c subunit
MSEESSVTVVGPAKRFEFPRWSNYALPAIAVMAMGGALYMPVAVGLGFSPKTTAVGYAPEQPVPYSHALHAGKLGMDCRVCHSTVEKAAFAAIPPTQVCMGCHSTVWKDSPRLAPIRESFATGKPVLWNKVHDLPDYAYFNHSAHVSKGVSCVKCHGRIDQMDVVQQVTPLSMGWCLECHRDPAKNLWPVEHVTHLGWSPLYDDEVKAKGIKDEDEAQRLVGEREMKRHGIRESAYMTSCYTCHR